MAPKWEEIAPDLKAPIVRCDTLLAMKRVAGRRQDLAISLSLREFRS